MSISKPIALFYIGSFQSNCLKTIVIAISWNSQNNTHMTKNYQLKICQQK